MEEADILLKLGVGGLILVLLVREGINFVKWSLTSRKTGSQTVQACQSQYYLEEHQRDSEDIKTLLRDCLKILRDILVLNTKLFDMHDVRENGQYVWYGNYKVCESMIGKLTELLAKLK